MLMNCRNVARMALQCSSTRREPQAREPSAKNALPGVPGNSTTQVDRASSCKAQTHRTSTSTAKEAGANPEKKNKGWASKLT